ncbi:MAG: efflux RND transporter periplasmic adaptor subunit [Reyranellaceae bacterium]
MRINRSYVIAGGILGAIGLWMLSGAFAVPKKEPAAAPQTAAVAAPSVRVGDFAAQEMTREINVRGQSAAVRIVELKAETAGRVVETLVEKGATVRKGDVIAKLALDDRPARLAELKAIIAQRERELNAASSLATRGYGPDLRASEARATMETARAAMARLEVDIANTEIKAPIDGTLDERVVEVGAYLKVGDKVGTVVDLSTILVAGAVTEREVPFLAVGKPGSAQLITGEKLQGRIRFISTAADSATRTFRVELEAPNPDRRARSGVTADLRLPLDAVKGHRVSPAILTLDENGRIGVKAVDGDSKVRFMPVQILSDSADAVWLGGLPDQVRLITVGQEYVVDGQVVTPVAQPAK